MDDLKKAGLTGSHHADHPDVVSGAPVAAGIPLLLALTAAATFGQAIPSQIWPSDESLYAMILLIALAVGVDY